MKWYAWAAIGIGGLALYEIAKPHPAKGFLATNAPNQNFRNTALDKLRGLAGWASYEQMMPGIWALYPNNDVRNPPLGNGDMAVSALDLINWARMNGYDVWATNDGSIQVVNIGEQGNGTLALAFSDLWEHPS